MHDDAFRGQVMIVTGEGIGGNRQIAGFDAGESMCKGGDRSASLEPAIRRARSGKVEV